MKKADNFNPGKWLVENKITTQSRLNENEEFNNDFPSLNYNTITNFIKSKGYKITSDYYDSGFDVNDGEYFVGIFDDHIAVTGDDGQVKDIPFNESRLNEQKYIKIDNSEYYVDENGNVKLSLNFPYEFNRSHKYNTPREEYIDKNNWKEKVNPSYPIMKVINNVPTADYEFIEYPSGDKELLVKTNIEDLKKYADGNYTLK